MIQLRSKHFLQAHNLYTIQKKALLTIFWCIFSRAQLLPSPQILFHAQQQLSLNLKTKIVLFYSLYKSLNVGRSQKVALLPMYGEAAAIATPAIQRQ